MLTALSITNWSGIVSHHRSLLVWPEELSPGAQALLAMVAATGTRILALGRPLDPDLVGDLRGRRVAVWSSARRPASPPGSQVGDRAVTTGLPDRPGWQAMQVLHRACGLTPLPGPARCDPQWTHARLLAGDGRLLATASRQSLPRPMMPTTGSALVCCLATRPADRRRGAAGACVAALLSGGEPAGAIVESATAAGFFRRIGWTEAGAAWLYRWL